MHAPGAPRFTGKMGFVAVVAAFMGVLAVPATSVAARPARRLRLTGEQFSATVDGTSYFVPGACYTGGPATATFSFSGQATGPYPGTYTETGTFSYALNSSTDGDEIASGPITGFHATFTITSPNGVVRGTEHLDSALPVDQDARCSESAGGTSFYTDAFEPVYTATLRTGHQTRRDHGRESAELFSDLGLGGTVADSGETEALTSAERSGPGSQVRRSSRRRRDHPDRRAEGARLAIGAA